MLTDDDKTGCQHGKLAPSKLAATNVGGGQMVKVYSKCLHSEYSNCCQEVQVHSNNVNVQF